MSDDWEPEDGAGYIPTEEGGSGRGSMVPESALRELVEKWRDGYDVYQRATDPETDIRANMLEQCADDLEELIDD